MVSIEKAVYPALAELKEELLKGDESELTTENKRSLYKCVLDREYGLRDQELQRNVTEWFGDLLKLMLNKSEEFTQDDIDLIETIFNERYSIFNFRKTTNS